MSAAGSGHAGDAGDRDFAEVRPEACGECFVERGCVGDQDYDAAHGVGGVEFWDAEEVQHDSAALY